MDEVPSIITVRLTETTYLWVSVQPTLLVEIYSPRKNLLFLCQMLTVWVDMVTNYRILVYNAIFLDFFFVLREKDKEIGVMRWSFSEKWKNCKDFRRASSHG